MADTRTTVDQTGATPTVSERPQTLDEYQQELVLRLADPDDPLDAVGMGQAICARVQKDEQDKARAEAEKVKAEAEASTPKRGIFAVAKTGSGYMSCLTPHAGCINTTLGGYLDILPRKGPYWDALKAFCAGGIPMDVPKTAKSSGKEYTAYGIILPDGEWIQIGRVMSQGLREALAELLDKG